MNNVLLDLNKIKIMRINILAKNIIQNPNPKKAVHTNFDGLMNGHNAQRNEKKRAANPHTPIIDFHKP